MASAVCSLGHMHQVCDKCGGSGVRYEDDDKSRKPGLSAVKLVISAGGTLGEALLCNPCMYMVRDAFTYALATGREGAE